MRTSGIPVQQWDLPARLAGWLSISRPVANDLSSCLIERPSLAG